MITSLRFNPGLRLILKIPLSSNNARKYQVFRVVCCQRYPHRQNTEGRESAAKEALQEIRDMHKAWKAKLEAETVEGELSDGSDD